MSKPLCGVVITGAALTACSPAAMAPQPQGTPTLGASGSSASVNIANPIPLDGIDPCKTLTDAQKKNLNVDYTGVRKDPLTNLKTCNYSSPHGAFYIEANTLHGLDWVDTRLAKHYTDTVGSYPARRVESLNVCTIDVGTAPHQMLTVLQGPGFDGGFDASCTLMRPIAEAAVETIKKTKG